MRRTDVVLVTGVAAKAGRGAAAWFAGRGLRVIGADARDAAWGRDFTLLPPPTGPDWAEGLLWAVNATGAGLLVPASSDGLPALARLREQLLALGCALPMGDSVGVRIANDKLLTARFLTQHRVGVPRTLPAGISRLALLDGLGLPVLQKPRVGHGGEGVRLLRTRDEVLQAPGGDVVWQEFLPGEEFDVNLFLERDGEVSAAAVLRKAAPGDGAAGNGAAVERAAHPEVLDEAVRAARVLGLAGPVDVDVRLGRDGQPGILDVNARVGANALAAPEVLEALHRSWRAGRLS